MEFPKLVIASDGTCTAALLDEVFIGPGIERLDFSTQDKNGEMKATIRIMELNVERTRLEPDSKRFEEVLKRLFDHEYNPTMNTATPEEAAESTQEKGGKA